MCGKLRERHASSLQKTEEEGGTRAVVPASGTSRGPTAVAGQQEVEFCAHDRAIQKPQWICYGGTGAGPGSDEDAGEGTQ